jgi:energy-coupling factor transporter ATP-binding protein EcfA2
MPRVRARLSSTEFAEGAVLGALGAVLVGVGKLLPHLGVIELFAVVPFAVLGTHPRLRAVVCGAIAGTMIATLIAGPGAGAEVAGCAVIGGFTGWVVRREHGLPTVLTGGAVVGVTTGIVIDLVALVLSSARDLAFASVRGVTGGVAALLAPVPGFAPFAGLLRAAVRVVLASWWIWLPAGALIGSVAGMVVLWVVLMKMLHRLPRPTRPGLGVTSPTPAPARPVPVALRRAWLGDGARSGSAGIDAAFREGEFVVVTGANGAGKSTLLHLLAGAPATSGAVDRSGGVGLGEVGGTALLLQRPETQVLGMTVLEDLQWGLPETHSMDVGALLQEVGLGGMEDRPTAGLSGGQLQRLALAAALAHRPALLLSDESTAMTDEASLTDRQLVLDGGRVVHDGAPRPVPGRPSRGASAPLIAQQRVVLRAEGVGVVRAAGTPWEHVVLREVDLTLRAGDGLRLAGANGSGKSTLAGVLAGLERPTSGRCLVDDLPADRRLGRVGIVFQHARLQVQRPVVAIDIAAAAGVEGRGPAHAAGFAAHWLEQVGLGPEFGARRVDELSGGQLRRVALAGVLASRPEVLILDEPFAGLDPEGRGDLVETLREIRSQGAALVVITHDAVEGLWDRAVELRAGILQ